MNNTHNSKDNVNNVKHVSAFLIFLSLILGLSLGVLISTIFNKISNVSLPQTTTIVDDSTFFDSEYLNEIYNRFQQEYIGSLPKKEDLTYGVVKGLISSLNDPYTFFLNPDEAVDYLKSRSPDFEGIGITLKFEDNNTVIESVLEGYPAQSAGVKSGDIISKVNGENIEGIQPNVVATKIRGEKGTEVVLELYRPESKSLLEIKAIREKIEVSNIKYKSLGNGTYKIDISQFIDDSVESFNNSWDIVVNEIAAKNDAQNIIIDLRNNPGGYVASVKHVMEEFLKNGQTMMFEESKASGKIEYKDKRVGKLENVKLVVLVNEGSASASEIFAASIQDNNRGKVIGKPTVGKGVEQQIITDLPDKSILIMVFQKWLTPDGRNISKENPIKPDYELDYTNQDFDNQIDPQLNKGLELLN